MTYVPWGGSGINGYGVYSGESGCNFTSSKLDDALSYFELQLNYHAIGAIRDSEPRRVTITKTNHIPYTAITGGVILNNYTFSNKLRIFKDITVASGVTLTIDEGTEIFFDPGVKLIVNGYLSAKGTSSNPITFTRSGSSGKWGGIRLQNDHARFNNVIIEHASTGILSNDTKFTVKNSKIRNCTVGISSIDVFSPGKAEITNNEIYNNSTGVYYENSLTWIGDNNIHNNGIGLELRYYSDIEYLGAVRNNIHHNGFGVIVQESSPYITYGNILLRLRLTVSVMRYSHL